MTGSGAVTTAKRLVERGQFRRLGRGSYLVPSASDPERWYPVTLRRAALGPHGSGQFIARSTVAESVRAFCGCEGAWSGRPCGHALFALYLRDHPNLRSK